MVFPFYRLNHYNATILLPEDKLHVNYALIAPGSGIFLYSKIRTTHLSGLGCFKISSNRWDNPKPWRRNNA